MWKLLRRVGRFELHHQILFFSAVLIATILFVRMGVQVYNPNPVFGGIELHHFDYGLILLLITVKLLLFGSAKYHKVYLVLAALGTALVIDGYLTLRLTVVEPKDPLVMYNNTTGYVAVSIVTGILLTLILSALKKRRDNMGKK